MRRELSQPCEWKEFRAFHTFKTCVCVLVCVCVGGKEITKIQMWIVQHLFNVLVICNLHAVIAYMFYDA